jgi:hypothetical protein
MLSIVVLGLFIAGCVLVTVLMAVAGSGRRAAWPAFKGFGGWIGGLLLVGFLVWAFMPVPAYAP